MISASTHDHNSETPFVEFLKSLEAATDPSTVVADFARRYPQHGEEFRELAHLDGALIGGEKRSLPPPPERLGEFRIIRLISFGGMGEIYEAYHERLDRRVALKIIRRGWSSDESRERFVREQQVLANLHHTHIVPIHTGGEDGKIQYFTMPFIKGASLNYVVSAVASLGGKSQSNKTPRLSEIVEQVVKQTDSSTVSSVSTLTHKGNSTKLAKEQRPNLPPRLRLSREYFESVATTVMDVAGAVEYAHNAGVLHRDLKPSNVMVEPNGHSWVIDFGLAAARQHCCNGNLQSSQDTNPPLKKDITQQGCGGGTVNYMSPERWQGQPADELSDVFSLGAMLYELLTLRRAFDGNSPAEIEANIASGKHPAANKLVRPLTIDLEAIAEKAMHKQPGLRYQSAGDMAEDLQRWLRNEPTIARPPWVPRRLVMWTQRKPAFASAVLLTILALLGTVGTVLNSYQNRAVAADLRTAVARAARRETALQLLPYQIQSEHTVGWSERSWDIVRNLAKEGSSDLKELAAATCLGVDAQIAKEFKFGPSQMAYDSTGRKLLMVGSNNDSDNATSQDPRAMVWDTVTKEVQHHSQVMHDAAGTIAYSVDGVPVQLAWHRKDSSAILLWSIEKQEVTRRMECPFSLSEPPLAWSIVPDGSHAAVLVRNLGATQILVWDTDSAIHQAQLNSAASQIELSPDGTLIAAACEKGTIEIWSTTKLGKIATLSVNHTDILCFAWTKDRMRPLNGGQPGWLLATGATGGDVTIWDVERESVRSRCNGSAYDVFRVAFSPDGMTLASAGRTAPFLWNVATGSMLLKLHYANTMTSVAFSPNGESLVVGSCAAHGSPDHIRVYEIQEKRGQQVLRGLRARVTQVRISADNRIVAALTDNWQLAVWDLQLNRLLHVLQSPIGVYAQSAGLALDADERRVAVVAGSEAKVWDIDSGNELKSVNLKNRGFLDSLVFRDPDTLVSARQESIDPEFPPFGPNPHPDRNPRVCRVRNLLAIEPDKPQLEIPDFKRTAVSITVTPAGNRLLIQGFDEPGKMPEHRITKLFDLTSGKELWSLPAKTKSTTNGIGSLDPTGRIIAMMEEGSSSGGWNALVDLESGRRVRASDYSLIGLGPSASINVIVGDEPVPGARPVRTVVQGESDQELVRIGLVKHSSERVEVSNDSRYVVFGCSDGSVTVTDLHRLQRELARVGLGW